MKISSEETRGPPENSYNDLKKLYKRFSQTITLPMAGSILDSGPPSPPTEMQQDFSMDSALAPSSPLTEEEDIDTALPIDNSKNSNYFVNILSSVQVFAGLNNGTRKSSATKHQPRSDNEPETEAQNPERPPHEIYLEENYTKKEGEKEELTPEEEAEVARQQKLLDDAQRAHELKGSLAEEDERKISKILASLAAGGDQNDLDQLYKAELEKEQDSSSVQTARRGSIVNTSDSLHSSSTFGGSIGGATGSGISLSQNSSSLRSDAVATTPFQKSVVENIVPHFLRESILVKLKKTEIEESKNGVSGTQNELDFKRKRLYLQIADKLQKVFELDDDDIFYGNYSAWLVRDVLLQGHLYLTKKNILFFAFLPDRHKHDEGGDESVQTGSLGMKAAKYVETVLTTVLTHRFWAILKPDTLSIFSSSTDLYFPNLVIDLNTCIRAEVVDKGSNNLTSTMMTESGSNTPAAHAATQSPRSISSSTSLAEVDIDADNASVLLAMKSNEIEEINESVTGGVWFKLVTTKKTYRFHTDNLYSARQWVNNLTKIIFEKNNSNAKNEVLCKIPIDKVIDFERHTMFDGAMSEDSTKMNGNSKEAVDDSTVEIPSSLTLSYLASNAIEEKLLSKEGMKKKLKAKTKIERGSRSKDVDLICFMFFREAENFMKCFKEIILEHRKNETSSNTESSLSEKMMEKAKKIVRRESVGSMSSLRRASTGPSVTTISNSSPVSTLQPSNNTLLSLLSYSNKLRESAQADEVKDRNRKIDSNCLNSTHETTSTQSSSSICEFNTSTQSNSSSSSKIKKISKSLVNPVKILSSNNNAGGGRLRAATSPSDNAGPSPFLERSNSEAQLDSLSASSTSRLTLPRQISVTGLKNLNMSFETSTRDIQVAESRYANKVDSPSQADPKMNFEVGDKEGDANASDISENGNEKHELLKRDSILSLDDDKSKVSLTNPLNLTDPVEFESDQKKKRSSKLKKGLKAFENVYHMWSAHPNHYKEYMENDPYFVNEPDERESAYNNFIDYFKLRRSTELIASYYCHLKRSIPVYGSLYMGSDCLCFKSLLPGVKTRMILPLEDIEDCNRGKGHSINYSGLSIVIKGFEEIVIEFSSQKARDDCEGLLLSQIDYIHKKHSADRPRRDSSVSVDSSESHSSQKPFVRSANSRIENARIKLFEDKINFAMGLDVPLILEDSPFFKTEIRPATSFNFTLLTIGSRGDVQPYIALAKGLIAEGHRVTIATHVEFKDWIIKHKINFKPIAGDPTELMALMVSHGSMSVNFIKEASAKFRGWIKDLLNTSWEACQGTEILIESPSAMAGLHIAEALGIPYFRAFTMPWTRTRAYPHAFIVPDQKRSGSYNYLTHVMFETVFWKGISSQINRWRVEELGIPRTNLYKMQQSKVPFLYNISPSIYPPSVDFPDWIKVTGYWFLEEGSQKDNYEPPQKLVEFMEKARNDNKKIVYIGFGSIVVKNAKELTKAVVDAVLSSDVRCILNKGWSDRTSKNEDANEPEIELPPEVYNSGNVPHDWLFSRIDAAVHHGGSGTTGATLKAGLPTVIKPFFGDQFFYASRVEDIEVGLGLKKLNSKSLSKCLKIVTTDKKMIERARKISSRIRHENGVLNAIECIYSELEYARNLSISKHLDYNKDHIISAPFTPATDEQEEGNTMDAKLTNNNEEPEECGENSQMGSGESSTSSNNDRSYEIMDERADGRGYEKDKVRKAKNGDENGDVAVDERVDSEDQRKEEEEEEEEEDAGKIDHNDYFSR
ncbi:sterol 3-beta-glucosyltransferase [[Candida] railenensis]|uniref:Sterol 3-beta-glucosyltransferase n=1 Tax=[Candida] railenensis TaxID=45579 RepID=A0A9P0QWU9_9ASCO|nr:sterol 3-beta-glucosyltransferase [[Candida] railenensis]